MSSTNKKLWFRKPATSWLEALPIGNGKLGAMIFGHVHEERFQLNEESIWAGNKIDANNYEAINYLPEVRKLLFEGKYKEAQMLADEKLLAVPKNIKPYETLGDLYLEFNYKADDKEYKDYKRELNLEEAISSVKFKIEETTYFREAFVSEPHDVMVIKLEASESGKISFRASLTRDEAVENISINSNTIAMISKKELGINFCAELRILNQGGSIKIEDNYMVVEGADKVILLLTAKTSFRHEDYAKSCSSILDIAQSVGYDELKRTHIEDYTKLFNRVDFGLESSENLSDLATDERLKRVKSGEEDLDLVSTYFHLGRYLLISCSRPGCLPANLQGLWNDSLKPAWNSDYHLNINLQMNYWLAESCNLQECHEPLFDFIESLVEPGRKTAKVHYNCKGFVVHHVTDIFGFTSPADGARYGVWPMGAAWLCQHYYEHYLYSKDREFLKKYYRVMKESAEFFVDFLIEDKNGYLITAPSISPENTFIYNEQGDFARLGFAPTMDMQIIYDLFTNCINASEILGEDIEFATRLSILRDKLVPPRIGKYGQLQEWYEDFKEQDPAHRHISHVFGFYPGKQFTLKNTPDICEAIRKSIERRIAHGGGGTGWSRAWLIGLFARFEDGDMAYEHIQKLLRESTLNNLFDLHPPSPTAKTDVFQIDGNLGTTAAIAEMLMHSHDDEIKILPALPKAWKNGKVSGLRARNGFEVDITWKENEASKVRIVSLGGETCRVKTTLNPKVYLDGRKIYVKVNEDSSLEFKTEIGKEYIIY